MTVSCMPIDEKMAGEYDTQESGYNIAAQYEAPRPAVAPSTGISQTVAHTIRRYGMAAGVMFLVTACSPDAATAPAAPKLAPGRPLPTGTIVQAARALPRPQVVSGVLRASPLADDVTQSAVIGSDGGRIDLPEAGFSLVVPRGAVAQPTAFSVTALKGRMLAYQFEPHGTTFAVPLVGSQDLRVVDLLSARNWTNVQAAYFADQSALDDAQDKATVSEMNATVLDLFGWQARFTIWHFSGYMVSSGRSDPNDQ